MQNWTNIKHRDPHKWCEFQNSVRKILDCAMNVDGAVKGNVQLYNHNVGALQIVAHRGFFDLSFLELFERVDPNEFCACSRAFRNGWRVVIPDIATDPLFRSYVSICRANGIRAVQSTPIIGPDGSPMGVLSTHFSEVHHLSETAKLALDAFASKIAGLVGDFSPSEAESEGI